MEESITDAPEVQIEADIEGDIAQAEAETSAAMTDPMADIEGELAALSSGMPSIAGRSADELVDGRRYSELRALGLTPREAFLATAKKQAPAGDNRAHLFGSAPRSMHAPYSAMTQAELAEAREIFGGMADEDIRDLYRKVTKQR